MMSTGFWSDQPPVSAAEDYFGFQDYAEALGQAILTCSTPLTIGIFGPRGAGKTSLLRLMWLYLAEQRALETRRPYGIWFDARCDPAATAPWRRLLLQVLAELKQAALTPADIHDLTQWETLLTADRQPVGRVATQLATAPASRELMEEFRTGFARLMTERLWNHGSLLAVFIDELDDCAPDHVLALCDTILSFLAVPGCVVVLGADRGHLTEVLRQRHADPAGILEKLIQLPFILPPLQETHSERFLTHIAPDVPGEARRILIEGLPPSPRRLKRILNFFRLLLELASQRSIRGSTATVDPGLLAKIIVIYERYPALYQDLCTYPQLLQELEAHARGLPPEPGDAFLPGADTVAALRERYAGEQTLVRILCSGASFATLPLPEVSRYIHLTLLTAADQKIAVGSEQRLWEDMLSGDLGRIRAAVKMAQQREWHPRYVNALVQFVQRRRPTPVEQRLSAAWALGYLGDPRNFDEVVEIPAGEFPCGEAGLPYYLLAYRIRRYLVTNAEYAEFLQAHPDVPVPQAREDWARAYNWDPEQRTYPPGKGNHPVVLVTWDEAAAYCAWVGGRLPTQEEWERAARGHDGRIYPWGNDFTSGRANTRESGLGSPTPVGVFVDGESAEGLLDMAGNVWEWTASDYDLQTKVLRGGAWNFPAESAKVFAFERSRPDNRSHAIGFRVVFPPLKKPA